MYRFFFFFSSRRRHTRSKRDWSSDVCSSDLDGGLDAIETGGANLARHLGIVREFGLNAVVAVNRFPAETDEEIELVRRIALEHGAYAAEVNDGFGLGGAGAAALAEAAAAAAEESSSFDYLYP